MKRCRHFTLEEACLSSYLVFGNKVSPMGLFETIML